MATIPPNKNANLIFIVGTDTDVGKTMVTAALYRAALEAKIDALIVKPIQTGAGAADAAHASTVHADAEIYCDATRDLQHQNVCGLAPQTWYSFSTPCSPHWAARRESCTISLDELAGKIKSLPQKHSLVILEGAGGVFVPINENETFLDLITQISARVVLVVANKLGCINHALLTIETLRNRSVEIAGIVMNHLAPQENLAPLAQEVLEENPRIIAHLSGIPILASMPFDVQISSRDENIRLAAWKNAAAKMRSVCDSLGQKKHAEKKLSQNTENDLLEFDARHLWHPYTSATNPHPVICVQETRGTKIITNEGKELIDGMSSWWCALHGYNHPHIIAAMTQQLRQMPHIMFGGITHRAAISLAKLIFATLPEIIHAQLTRIFFADSGSVSVEVALKMAIQFFASTLPRKSRFITFRGGYHGDTCGAMSVSDPENGMHSLFAHTLAPQVFLPRPSVRFGDDTNTEKLRAELTHIETLFAQHASETAGFIAEPIVQGAGGMWFYHAEYLRHIRRLCDKYNLLFIADEIATGFGRTGKMFACEWSNITPDILCLGKSLTGGVMTLAATLTSDRVAKQISTNDQVFMHGPTFMANPLACAAARASLELLATGNWQTQIARIEAALRAGLAQCTKLSRVPNSPVADVRILGGIGVVEMRDAVNTRALQKFFVSRNVWIRPFGKLIYLMPPYIISDDEIQQLTRAVCEAINEML